MSKSSTQIYNAVERVRLEVKSDIQDFRAEVNGDMKTLRKEVDSNTNWRNQITGKITFLLTIIGIAVNSGWNLVVNRN